MAKKKKISNPLKFKDSCLHLKFLGTNGRFGNSEKLFGDFSEDETVEFYLSHNKKTRDKYMTGVPSPDYVSPFDSPAPEKPSLDV